MKTYINRHNKPLFTVITGNEKYKVIDLDTNGKSYFDDKVGAYRHAWVIMNYLGHNYRLEIQATAQVKAVA